MWATILLFLETNFSFLFTAVTGIFNTILSEIPDDEIAILHGAMNAVSTKFEAGGTAEEAFTAGLNFAEAAEVGELSKLGRELLQAFVTATVPVAVVTANPPATT